MTRVETIRALLCALGLVVATGCGVYGAPSRTLGTAPAASTRGAQPPVGAVGVPAAVANPDDPECEDEEQP